MLQIVDIAHNNFSGEIPGRYLRTWRAMMPHKDDAMSNHFRFEVLKFSEVYFQDAITVTNKGLEMELVKILTVFTSIDMSCNKFNGSIPGELGELKSLYGLNLSNNALTGTIPSSLGNLEQLESLDLSKNSLSGPIPQEVGGLTFLSFLDLSNNQLVGQIPVSTQISTFPAASFAGNKRLWGPPLTVDNKAGLSPPPALMEAFQILAIMGLIGILSVLKLDSQLALDLPLGHLRSARDGVNGITKLCITSFSRYSLRWRKELVFIEDMFT
ncbi:unnamed protein product [Prunus armeniaca]